MWCTGLESDGNFVRSPQSEVSDCSLPLRLLSTLSSGARSALSRCCSSLAISACNLELVTFNSFIPSINCTLFNDGGTSAWCSSITLTVSKSVGRIAGWKWRQRFVKSTSCWWFNCMPWKYFSRRSTSDFAINLSMLSGSGVTASPGIGHFSGHHMGDF